MNDELIMPQTNNEKLVILASFDQKNKATFGKRLQIRNNGDFELVGGVFANVFQRKKEDSLTSKSNYDRVNGLLTEEITKLAADPRQFQQVVSAYRGYSRLLKEGYAGRINDGLKQSFEEIHKGLESSYIKLIYKDKSYRPGQLYLNSQKTFISDDKVLGEGNCYGIACLWAARWVLSGKKGYATSKNSPNPVSLSGQNDRVQNKNLLIHAFQNNQHKINQGANLRDILRDAYIPGAPLPAAIFYLNVVNNSQAINNNYNTLFNQMQARGYNKQASSQEHLIAKSQKYINLQTSTFHKIKLKQVTFAQAWEDEGIEQLIEDIFIFFNSNRQPSNMGNCAFLLSWMAKNPAESSYYMKEGAGHCMACFKNEADNKWYFMDPNFGEWNGDETYVKKIVAFIASYYSLSYEYKHWEIVKLYQETATVLDHSLINMQENFFN